MDLPVRKKLPHTIPQWVPEGSSFFITIKCVPPGMNQLCRMDAPAGRQSIARRTRCQRPTARRGLTRPSLSEDPARRGLTRPTLSVGDQVMAAMAHNHDKLLWHCRLCLLMPDHLHAIIAFPREPGMKTLVTNWKKFVAVKLGVQWQRDFFDHRLRDNQQLVEKTEYILMNPVRRGLCERMEDWVWAYRPTDRPPPLVV